MNKRPVGKALVPFFVSLTVLTVASVLIAQVSVIDVPLTGSLSGFGTFNEFYRGQTFTAVPGLARELTVYVGPTADPAVRFRVLLTGVTTTGAIRPTNVLFESATLTKLFDISGPSTPFVVDLGGIPLAGGQKYAWILDAFADFDGTLSSAGVGIDLSGSYAGGEGISLHLGPFPGGTRADHFNANWLVRSNIDLAFRLVIDAVLTVALDIEPGVFPNLLDLSAPGNLPVAILTTSSFNAATVATRTVRFAGAAPVQGALQDVDGDGDLDLLLQFPLRRLNLTCASTSATLTGQTNAGSSIAGTDSVRIKRDRAGQLCP